MSRGLWCLLVCLSFVFSASSAFAGAKIKFGEESEINLGARLQTLYLNHNKDLDADGNADDYDNFKIRRARLRLGADINQYVSLFLQTEFSQDAAAGGDVRMIDAFIKLKPHKLANFVVGVNMAPSGRQALTSSGGLMAMDRPGITYKSLTWGTRAVAQFANVTYSDSDAGLRGDVDVRDLGITLFGSDSISDTAHFKYYLGVYNGVQKAGTDNERYAGRVQFNFFDAEAGYYGLSTYLGKKKTVGIGASFDSQSDVATDTITNQNVDYSLYSIDLFTDYPVGPGTITFEAAYTDLDLGGATSLDVNGDGSKLTNATQSEGNGYYAQTGYYINKWQPWAAYETWDAKAASGKGSYDAYRLGVTYFLQGHTANIKAGYEKMEADANFGSSNENSVDTFAVGLYVTF